MWQEIGQVCISRKFVGILPGALAVWATVAADAQTLEEALLLACAALHRHKRRKGPSKPLEQDYKETEYGPSLPSPARSRLGFLPV